MAFAGTMMNRRRGFVNEMIYQVIDRFIDLGFLPEPQGEIYIEWSDLTEPSTGDKLELGERMMRIDDGRYKTGREPFFSDEDYAKATGFIGNHSGKDMLDEVGEGE